MHNNTQLFFLQDRLFSTFKIDHKFYLVKVIRAVFENIYHSLRNGEKRPKKL